MTGGGGGALVGTGGRGAGIIVRFLRGKDGSSCGLGTRTAGIWGKGFLPLVLLTGVIGSGERERIESGRAGMRLLEGNVAEVDEHRERMSWNC